MRQNERDIEIETDVQLTVKVRGRYTPGSPPLAQRGEAVAVECPGWNEGIEDLMAVIVHPSEETNGQEVTNILSAADIESLEHELIEAARAKLEDSRY